MAQQFKEYTVSDFTTGVSDTVLYIRKRGLKIVLVTVLFIILGIVFSFFQVDKYVAKITFSNEASNEKKGGNFSGIAAQLGVILSNTDNYYEGRNLLEFLKRKTLLFQTLLSPTEIDSSNKTLLDLYISSHPEYDFKIDKNDTRQRDSILNVIAAKFLKKQFVVSKKKKELNSTTVTFYDKDEIFAKKFLEKFMANAIAYYSSYAIAKETKDKDMLLHITDSLRQTIGQDIDQSAYLKDLNINPVKQLFQTSIQKKQFSIQVTSAIYNEALRQLELENILLKKEKPFLEIIDSPVYPLENDKIEYRVAALIFGGIGFIMAIMFFLIKRITDNSNSKIFLPVFNK